MSIPYLIHSYLDEGLPEIEEEMLFAQLANDSHAREEFAKQMKINSIAAMDMNSLAPPADLSNSIFTQLGFAAPEPAISPVPLRKYKNLALLALLLLLTSLVSIALFNVYTNYNSKQYNSQIAGNENHYNLPKNIPFSQSFESESSALMYNNGIVAAEIDDNSEFGNLYYDGKNIGSDGNYADSKNNYQENSKKNRNNSNKLAGNNPVNSRQSKRIATNMNELARSNNYSSSNDILSDNNESITLHTNNLSRIELSHAGFAGRQSSLFGTNENTYAANRKSFREFPGATLSSFDLDGMQAQAEYAYEFIIITNGFSGSSDVGVQNSSNNILKEFGIAAQYNLSKYHSFGLEISQEKYGQKFYRTIDGQVVQQLQEPFLVSASPYYRFTYPVNEYFLPFAKVNFGGTSIGPVAKVNLGARIKIFNNISAEAGYSYGALVYNVENSLYTTYFSGLSGSLSYGF